MAAASAADRRPSTGPGQARPAHPPPAAPPQSFHDLRHTGNHFAAASGASFKDLMARMGHDSERAAIIYQHEARGADLVITSAIDAHIETTKATDGQHHDGTPKAERKPANGPLMAHREQQDRGEVETA